MESSPFSSPSYAAQSLPLRVTYKKRDYSVRLAEPRKITADCQRLEILLDGRVQVLERKGGRWHFAELPEGADDNLAPEIWRVLCLRYRV
ncbi:hypothetical protein [Parapedobacter sp. DT-150]|uniref:hypothetical protein n=1 Tax=Parapedobacter sp. DT-150 TaxID=3396162 RepID=UPI003F1B8301